MNNIKKYSLAVVLSLLLLVSIACTNLNTNTTPSDPDSGTNQPEINQPEIDRPDTDRPKPNVEFLSGLIEYFVQYENLHVVYKEYTGLGKFIVEIGELNGVSILSTIGELPYSNPAPLDFPQGTFYMSMLGIDSLPYRENARYLFRSNGRYMIMSADGYEYHNM